jgi:hypothetical protein
MSESKKQEDWRKLLNDAIALPVEMVLRSDDGRCFLVRSWKPSVELGSSVKVNAELWVEMRDGEIVSP